jgi:histidine triad (HIT) family protein
MNDCIFCKIAKQEIPAAIVYQNEKIIAFNDISPAAPVHVLIIPRQHIESVQQIDISNASVLIDIHMAANEVAKLKGVADKGYRLINNCGKDAGQTVMHLHYHLIAGKDLGPKIL